MDTPANAYRDRIARYESERIGTQARMALCGNLRFGVFLVGLILGGVIALERPFGSWVLILPIVVFLILSYLFEKARQADNRAAWGIAWYKAGLNRLAENWHGRGIDGSEFQPIDHPFASDLDLFGRGSLFERLCVASTHGGRELLADWLLRPADLPTLQERRLVVQELATMLDFREALAMHGASGRGAIDTKALTDWANAFDTATPTPARRLAVPLVCLTLFFLLGWYAGWWSFAMVLVGLLVQGVFAGVHRSRVVRAIAGVRGTARDLFRLTGQIRLLEQTEMQAPRLKALREELLGTEEPPSRSLAELFDLIARLDSTRNSFFAAVAPLLLWTTQIGLAVEEWRCRVGKRLPRWLAILSEFEASASLANYAYESPGDTFAEIMDGPPQITGRSIGHPLLPVATCVRNDIRLDQECRVLIVSGSNMSGKSTYLRTIGINVVLALAGAPVRAERLTLTPLAIGATLRVQDSLQDGTSRFYAEIKRLKQVLSLTDGTLPVLFLIDEVFSGTNSHDRRIGAAALLKELLARPTIGLLTTHDLALTQTANDEPAVANVHFADELRGGELHFDYRMRPGVVTHSNALALMTAVGLLRSIEKPTSA